MDEALLALLAELKAFEEQAFAGTVGKGAERRTNIYRRISDALEDDDDVQKVFHNLEITEELENSL